MRNSRSASLGATCVLALTLAAGGISPALADSGGQAGDIVGVGSDTVQNIGDFLADGHPAITGFLAASGYNSAGNLNRVLNFSATLDANDRAAYGTSSATTLNPTLNPTVILRAGTTPVRRPNGSGQGIDALKADTTGQINYVRSSSASRIILTATTGFPIATVKLATDDVVMAAASAATNAVALSGIDLVHIYQCETAVSKTGGGTTDYTDWGSIKTGVANGQKVVPQIPQSGSGTYNTFTADLKTFNGGTSANLTNGCVSTVEENDPTSITGLSATAPNAIAPFSSGRKKLFDTGYFHTPAFPAGAALTSGVTLLYGTQTANSCAAPVAGQTVAYCDTRGLYIAWRAADTSSVVVDQPGGTANFVQDLFYTGDSGNKPLILTNAGKANLLAAGVTPVDTSVTGHFGYCGVTTGAAFAGGDGFTTCA